ncbi:hypothetical protein F6X40_10995 [Paraburkholderia sp. UCT31]|uniref:hypothetical protein n=1 Tax=Paraburkholderia sp. UCT31 TaxID=2615209 RepID=UPI0016551F23|nr:hypothetical protein [Paraburkholderia sp. UCT31]MBC8737329.1 hypothetical protein [Paraburkholderia sp. UCT31]
MSRNTIVSIGGAVPDMLNNIGTVFFEAQNMRYHRYAEALTVTLLDNALDAGKTCPHLHFKTDERDICVVWNTLSALIGGELTPQALTDYSRKLWDEHAAVVPLRLRDKVIVYFEPKQSIRVFSPFALKKLKPLDKVPAKMTLAFVKRALANGQYANLRCNYVLTDDYAWDAAVNFRKGAIDALPMLERIIESPSGWWTSMDGNPAAPLVSLCCHSFDSNSFTLKLDSTAAVA